MTIGKQTGIYQSGWKLELSVVYWLIIKHILRHVKDLQCR